jgi:glycolate oxidase
VEYGGAITGEHGVGIEKMDGMCSQFSQSELKVFAQLRAAFDPKGLMNPGKLIPTLRRCVELGRHHAHSADHPHTPSQHYSGVTPPPSELTMVGGRFVDIPRF